MSLSGISVIISTYNQPAWLEKVLWGYQMQTFRDFELIVADDGSGAATKNLIDTLKPQLNYPLIHIWQEDNGFQKNRVLNKAIMASTTGYIVVSDGDCIPRNDFLSVHDRYRTPGYFLSGGYSKLPMSVSEEITKNDIETGRCFDLTWLKARGLPSSFKNNKLTARGFTARLLNAVTPTTATWNGHNTSGWKKDILAVNGYDERMQYGGEDRELGERLFNYGIRAKQLRYSAICVHLDHARGYINQEALTRNATIRKHTREQKAVWTTHGIVKQEKPTL